MHLSPAFNAESAVAALVGGAGIGLVATIYAATNHHRMPSSSFNAQVHAGMIVASAIASSILAPQFFEAEFMKSASLTRLAFAGVLTGAGSKMGQGCTCGNGIQGLAALSPASGAFVVVFMAAGAAAAALGDQSAALRPTPTSFSWPLAAAAAGLAAVQLAAARNHPALSNVLCGGAFAVSLVQASMVKPSKIDGFLNFAGAAGWDPSLAFVMGGALLVALPLWLVFGVAEASSSIKRFAARPIDAATVLGGLAFGAGWGLGGLCPGPGVVTAGTGSLSAAVWTGCMFAARCWSPGDGAGSGAWLSPPVLKGRETMRDLRMRE